MSRGYSASWDILSGPEEQPLVSEHAITRTLARHKTTSILPRDIPIALKRRCPIASIIEARVVKREAVCILFPRGAE